MIYVNLNEKKKLINNAKKDTKMIPNIISFEKK